MWHYLIAGLLSLCVSVYAYSSGAPGGQCDQMMPGHGVAAQSGSSPYNIILSAEQYMCPNEEITVTVNGTSPFKGFLCQPRSNPSTYSTVGSLVASGSVSTQNNCGANAALTHTEGGNKDVLSFVWKSSASSENVYIVCTIVQEKNTFWVSETSNMIAFQTGGNCGGSGSGSGSGSETGSGSGSSNNSSSITSLKIVCSLILVFYLNSKRT